MKYMPFVYALAAFLAGSAISDRVGVWTPLAFAIGAVLAVLVFFATSRRVGR